MIFFHKLANFFHRSTGVKQRQMKLAVKPDLTKGTGWAEPPADGTRRRQKKLKIGLAFSNGRRLIAFRS
jgi:hypothetical protein